jgi:hypothetical protein
MPKGTGYKATGGMQKKKKATTKKAPAKKFANTAFGKKVMKRNGK